MVWILQWCKGVTAESMNGLPFTHGFCLSILYQHMLSVSPVISCGRFSLKRSHAWVHSEYTQPPLPLAAGHSYGGGAGVQPQVLPVRFSLSYLECCEPYYMIQGSGQHCLSQPAQPMQHQWYPFPNYTGGYICWFWSGYQLSMPCPRMLRYMFWIPTSNTNVAIESYYVAKLNHIFTPL